MTSAVSTIPLGHDDKQVLIHDRKTQDFLSDVRLYCCSTQVKHVLLGHIKVNLLYDPKL